MYKQGNNAHNTSSLDLADSNDDDGNGQEDSLRDVMQKGPPTRRGAQRQPPLMMQEQLSGSAATREDRGMTFGKPAVQNYAKAESGGEEEEFFKQRRPGQLQDIFDNQDSYYNDVEEALPHSKLNFHSYFVSSPTNLLETQQAQTGLKSSPIDTLFDIMDPQAKGFDRLLKEDDKQQLLALRSKLDEELKDLTTAENDVRYGYISKKNAI